MLAVGTANETEVYSLQTTPRYTELLEELASGALHDRARGTGRWNLMRQITSGRLHQSSTGSSARGTAGFSSRSHASESRQKTRSRGDHQLHRSHTSGLSRGSGHSRIRKLSRGSTFGAIKLGMNRTEWLDPLFTCEPLALYQELFAQQGTVSLAGHILAVGAAKLITVVDLDSGATLLQSPRSGRVRCVTLSSGGSLLVSGSFDSTLEMVDMTAGARLHHHRTVRV